MFRSRSPEGVIERISFLPPPSNIFIVVVVLPWHDLVDFSPKSVPIHISFSRRLFLEAVPVYISFVRRPVGRGLLLMAMQLAQQLQGPMGAPSKRLILSYVIDWVVILYVWRCPIALVGYIRG